MEPNLEWRVKEFVDYILKEEEVEQISIKANKEAISINIEKDEDTYMGEWFKAQEENLKEEILDLNSIGFGTVLNFAKLGFKIRINMWRELNLYAYCDFKTKKMYITDEKSTVEFTPNSFELFSEDWEIIIDE